MVYGLQPPRHEIAARIGNKGLTAIDGVTAAILTKLVMIESKGEARATVGEGTESRVAEDLPPSPALDQPLREEVCERENLKKALERVKANQGSPGIDGMTVDQLPEYLRSHWPTIRGQWL